MLNLTLKKQEAIQLGQGLIVAVTKIRQNKVELGVIAPKSIKVSRLIESEVTALLSSNNRFEQPDNEQGGKNDD